MAEKVWTCKDIMTPDPLAATKADTVREVAEKMRSADVGLIPIVENHYSNKVLGLVTDRDLALRLVAEGLDVNTTPVEAVMTPNPICCHPDDRLNAITHLMSKHQIRRILVTDEFGRMLGIIAQADLARETDPQTVGKLVEEISQES